MKLQTIIANRTVMEYESIFLCRVRGSNLFLCYTE